MSATPTVQSSITAIRQALALDPEKQKSSDFRLSHAIGTLYRLSDDIAGDRNLLEDVVQVATEVQAFRGKGCQSAARQITQLLYNVASSVMDRLPQSETTPEFFPTANDMPPSGMVELEKLRLLAARAFACVQGPPARSQQASFLRVESWKQLGLIAEIDRQPAHLDHALKVAADKRAAVREREAAVSFLPDYWGGNDPDKATRSLLAQLKVTPPDRDCLVTVLRARIDLGLDNEFGALCAVDEWDDADDEE